MSTVVRIVDSEEHFSRLAFTQFLFEAGTVGGEGEPAYSCTVIIPRDHPVHEEIEAAEVEAANLKWGAKGPDMLKSLRAAGKSVVKNGDLKANYDGFEGNDFISLRAPDEPEKKPAVFSRFGQELKSNDGTIYAGSYAHVKFAVWAQDNKWGKRINAQITGLQGSRDGDSFGAGAPRAKADDFADLRVKADPLLD